jgi:hypothetical protein
MVEQRGTTAVARLEIDGLIRRGALLPTPEEETDPRACQRAYGGLRRVPLIALRLVIAPRPAGRPARFGGPLDERVPEERWTLEAPVPPGLLAAACGDRRDPRLWLPFGGGGITVPWFAAGDEPPGGADGTRAWESREPGASRMGLSALGDGVSNGRDGLQGDPERLAQGLDPQGMGRDHALIGGQGGSRLEGVEARGHHVRRAPMGVAAAGFPRGAPGQVRGVERRPAAPQVTEQVGSLVLEPWQPVWARGVQGAREAVDAPDVGVDHPAAVCDEWGERTPRRALRRERRELIARGAEAVERECGVGGVVCGPARGEGVAIPHPGQGSAGTEDQQIVRAQGGDPGPRVACEAASPGLAGDPRAPRAAPRRDGFRRGLEREALACGGARRLETPIMVGISPVEAHKGGNCCVGYTRHVASPRVGESGEKGQAS